MKTTAEILQESRALRLSFKPPEPKAELSELRDYPAGKLPWLYYFGQVLGAVGSSLADCILNLYFDEGTFFIEDGPIAPEDITVIKHGHSRDGFCCSNTCCHVLGYKPNGDLPPALQKQWKKFGYAS